MYMYLQTEVFAGTVRAFEHITCSFSLIQARHIQGVKEFVEHLTEESCSVSFTTQAYA